MMVSWHCATTPSMRFPSASEALCCLCNSASVSLIRCCMSLLMACCSSSVLAVFASFGATCRFFLGLYRHLHLHAESIPCIYLSSNLTTGSFWESSIFDPLFCGSRTVALAFSLAYIRETFRPTFWLSEHVIKVEIPKCKAEMMKTQQVLAYFAC